MKIIIDDKIPYIKNILEPFAEVLYVPGGEFTHDIVKDADALITRTRTKCNKQLLDGSKVKFIATATIGFDHIDTEFCKTAGISWTNAPGCNSGSVQQYIASALLHLAKRQNFDLPEKTLGIVGVGNVGKKIAKIAKIMGMKVLLNDPPRERAEGKGDFVDIADIKEKADIITFHVPLNIEGIDKTYHLADDSFFKSCKTNAWIINSSRGEVIETKSVLNALKSNKIGGAILDVWENEPQINIDLLNNTLFGSPHIAGYSKDGKANGTAMSVNAVSKYFGLPLIDWFPNDVPQPENNMIQIDCQGKSLQDILFAAINFTYDIQNDDKKLKRNVADFEKQRGDYPLRREFGVFNIKLINASEQIHKTLADIGFQIVK